MPWRRMVTPRRDVEKLVSLQAASQLIFGSHTRDGAIFAHASDVRLQHCALHTAGARRRAAQPLDSQRFGPTGEVAICNICLRGAHHCP